MAGTCTIINEESALGNRDYTLHWDTGLGPNPSQIRTLSALNGDSTSQTPNSVCIVQRTSGSGTLRLKGVSGDTGILLRPADPTVFCPLGAYVLTTSSASDVTIVEA